ncbi:MAG: (Fe-S)-binding protein, partial [Acidimicrobiia bacterium]
VPLDAEFEETMTFCLNCRACEAVCPSLVPFGRAMEGARAEIAAQRPRWSRKTRHWVLGRVLPSRRLMAVMTRLVNWARRLGLQGLVPRRYRAGMAGLRMVAPATRPRLFPAANGLGRVGLLLGCVMEPWFGEVNRAAEALLTMAGFEVIAPTSQTCCGALAAHDGAMPAAVRLATINARAFEGFDLVVATAAGCSAHLRDYDHFVEGTGVAAKSRDITQVVADLIESERLPRLPARQMRVAVQDPCHLRHAQRIMSAPRTVLSAAGYSIVEIDPDGICCGAAGIYSVLRPEASRELGRRKAAQVESSGATLVASANPGCEIQLRSHLGPAYRVAHPVELYWDAVAADPNQ